MMGFNSFLCLLQQLNVFTTSPEPSFLSFLSPSSFHFTVTMGHCRFCLSFLFLVILVPTSTAQLRPTQTTLIFQVQKLLEYPEALQGWNNWTNFCFLPPSPSLSIVCSGDRVTELTISGNKTTNKTRHTLSHSFDIDSFFTALTKLSDLKVLSLVSLGLWGPLPAKINRLQSLQVLNLSSNSIRGRIPSEISSLKSLKSLVLADNLFNASVPDLRGLAQLQELNLGRNNLGPDFPSLPKNLTTLILKNNSFRSEIPSGIKGFDQLRQLDISSNEFLGLVPSFLFSLPSIQFLNLGANQLTGALPANTTCTKNLTFVDISHNLLIGKLPSCVSSSSSNRTVISSWNCLSGGNLNQQHTSSYCNKVALAVEPPSRTTEQGSTRLALGVVLGIIGGIVGLVAVAAAVILVILRRSETTRADNTKYDGFIPKESPVGASLRPVIDSRRVPQTMRSAAIGLPQYRVFAMEEIEDATNNFDQSNLMGEDSQGKLYKGWLGDGSVAVIKCVKLKQRHLSQNLMQNMEALSKLRHQHLVSVLGHCMVTYEEHPNTASTVFIVLEHISNGCLRDYLTDWRRKDMLKWPQRMAITIGAARGIQFLHTGVAPGIFGNNLKMENILLDETLTAKLSNYHIPLLPKVDAESPLSSDANAEKEDIYQLGVILLEVITGKQVESTGELEGLKLELEMSLTEGPSKVRDLIDPSIRGTFAYESMRTTIEFAIKCLCKDSSKRPSVEDVLWNLQYSIQVQEGWNSSGNLNAQPLWYDL